MLLFTASAGKGEDGRAAILVRRRRKKEGEEEKEEGKFSGWLRGHHGRFERMGECKSFPTGETRWLLRLHQRKETLLYLCGQDYTCRKWERMQWQEFIHSFFRSLITHEREEKMNKKIKH